MPSSASSTDVNRALAAVTVRSRSLWTLRLSRGIVRWAVCAVAVVGIVATVRYTLAPPRPRVVAAVHADPRDPAAEGYASLFARRYLTWDSAAPLRHQQGLAAFVGGVTDPDAGFTPPGTGSQQVAWSQVVQVRAESADEHVYTIAAQTDAAGLLYLSVPVIRRSDGRLALAGYPAFVGAPASAPFTASAPLNDVEDPQLTQVVDRALSNYLAAATSDLAADLSAGARVAVPGLALILQRVMTLQWTAAGGSVLATLSATDQRGAQYTLSYELDVLRVGGRWEISAIQMDPNA